MARLPVLSGREVVRVFESLGWQVEHFSHGHGQMGATGVSPVLTAQTRARCPCHPVGYAK
jgi:predicted RNA binding protein YcfA (HicA-like mRNA interferase family)